MTASGTALQPNKSGTRTKWFSEFLFLNRTYILLTLMVVLAFNIGYWGLTNLLFNFYGWRIGPWVEPTLVAAEIGLAIGTLFLASGALLQSRAAGISNELASRQERRDETQAKIAAQLIKPHLDFQVLEAAAGATTQDTIVVGPNQWFIRCRLRNLGPGVAVELQVTAFNWWTDSAHLDEELAKLSTGGTSKEPLLTAPSPIPTDIVNVPFALVAGEARDFGLQFRIPPLPDKITGLLQQTVVIAWARDLQSGEVTPRKLGLRLDFAFPRPAAGSSEPAGLQTLWRWLTEEEVGKIPSLPTKRVSRRTGWWPPSPAGGS
jgi:hypothetical protein